MSKKVIPDNYNMIESKMRNIIETVVIDVILIYVIYSLNLTFKQNIYVGILLIPLSVFSYVGIGGQSLCTVVYNHIRFLKRRRVLEKPTQEYIRKQYKNNIKKKQKERTKQTKAGRGNRK